MDANQDSHVATHPSSSPHHPDFSHSDAHHNVVDCQEPATTDPRSPTTRDLKHCSHPELGTATEQLSLLSPIQKGAASTNPLTSTAEDPISVGPDQSFIQSSSDEITLRIATARSAHSPSTKLSLSPPESHSSLRPSYTKSVSEETLNDPEPSLDLGVELYQKLPGSLQRLVSPLFVEPYSDPAAVPTPYRPRLTSAFFRQAWREEYEQYVKSKPKNSLPSLFDLEMMASPQVDLKEPSDHQWVKTRLQAYGLHQDDDAALKRYPEVLKAAEVIIDRPRDSYPNEQDVEMFRAKLRTYRDSNEDTFLNQILPYFVKDARWVPARSSSATEPSMLQYVLIEQSADNPPSDQSQIDSEKLAQIADLTESEDRVSVSFFLSGLLEISNRDFSRTLPFFNDETHLDKDLNKDMEKDSHMTNPRPDRTFGVNPEKISWPSGFVLPRDIQLLIETVRSCYHVFLLLEAKAAGGSIIEARNQVCRGGAICINMQRHLRRILEIPEQPGPDLDTFMFSVVLTDQVLEVWVHWAEVHGHNSADPSKAASRETYHMNQVFTKALNEPGALSKIRRVLHKILDWGVGERLEKLGSVHEAIVAYAEDHNPPTYHASKKQKVQ
ncbi:MAG: hypothetical protein Q9219_005313 [cf. Caloplaca sp. 3 TL-2023]